MGQTLDRSQSEWLASLCKKHGLEFLTSQLTELALPCVALAAKGADAYSRVGNCRLGGLPDVPAGFTWPEETAFLMQLNMAEVGPLDSSGLLPRSGMLYFFLGDDEGHNNLPHRVVYVDTINELHRAEEPAGYNSVSSRDYEGGDTNVIYNPFELTIQSSVSLPGYGSRQYDSLAQNETLDVFSDKYFALDEELKVPRQSRRIGQHQVLGHCSCIDMDADVMASFSRFGLDPDLFRYDEANLKELILELDGEAKSAPPGGFRHDEYLLKERKKQLETWTNKREQILLARREVDSWVTLLDLDSDLNAGMCFWDAGRIHFMISRQDLTKMRLDRTYSGLISS